MFFKKSNEKHSTITLLILRVFAEKSIFVFVCTLLHKSCISDEHAITNANERRIKKYIWKCIWCWKLKNFYFFIQTTSWISNAF